MPDRKFVGQNYRFGFNGKENDNEVKGLGSQQDYGERIYDPRLGRFLSVDPITSQYPELTPYQFASNTPLQAIDLDGLEAANWVKAFGITIEKPKLKNGEWHRIINDFGLGRSVNVHKESFKAAIAYNSQNKRPEAYRTIQERSEFYSYGHEMLVEKGIDSRWFKAAGIVTQPFAVGGAELDHLNLILGNDAKDFLKEGNVSLFSKNMETFNQLYNTGKLNIDFRTANGKTGSHTRVLIDGGNGGVDMDYAMVMYEQLMVQDFMASYKKANPNKNFDKIMDQINSSFTSILASSEIKDVIKQRFEDKGRRFNFSSFEDRVELGKGVIDNIRATEKKTK